MYLGFLIVICLPLPITSFLSHDTQEALVLGSILLATALPLIVCMCAARQHLVAAEFILPLLVVIRGSVSILLQEIYAPMSIESDKCLSYRAIKTFQVVPFLLSIQEFLLF